MAQPGGANGSAVGLQTTTRARPETIHVQPANVTRWNRADYAGIEPERVRAVVKEAERGNLEDWADLAAFMLRTDPHVRSVYETRILSVAGAEYEIEPGQARGTKEQQLAERGAELARRSLQRVRGLERIFAHLLHAEGVGWSLLAHVWDEQLRRRSGEWHSTPDPVHSRDVRFAMDWVTLVRSFRDGRWPEWIRTDEAPPGAFVIHLPGSIGETPNLSGDLMSVAFSWVCKRWAFVFQQHGLERNGNPLIFAKMSEDADRPAMNEMFDSLNQLSGDHVGVIRGASEIEIKDPPSNVGSAYQTAIENLNNEITKAILGSTLNVDIGAIGSRAAAESQADTTILPRLQSDARRLANTIERDWLEPLMRFNAHLFGGQVPPTPKLSFTLVQDEPPKIDSSVLDALVSTGKGVRVNELRTRLGFEPNTPEEGGEEFAQPPEPSFGPGQQPFDRGDVDAAAEPRYGRVLHERGGEWRVVDADGNSLGVYTTKQKAVEALHEHEQEQARQAVQDQASQEQPARSKEAEAVSTSDTPDEDDWGDVVALQDEDQRNAARTRIGRLRRSVIEGVADTAVSLDRFRERLAEQLQGAITREDVEAAIELVADEMAEDDELEEKLFRTNMQANMAGELFVREVEVPRAKRQLSVRKLQEAGEVPFLELPFEEAIAQFQSKATLSPAAFEALQDAERFRAFRMKREVAASVTKQAKAHLNSMIEKGPSDPDAEPDVIREFIDKTRADEAALGFTPNNPFYLETVFRTSTGTSYGAGRYRGQTDPDVVEATGFWRYVTAGDSNVRPEHADLHGKIWRIGDPEAEAVYPPNSFNCRCVVTVLDADEVDESQLSRPVNADSAITEGFRGNPAGSIEEASV